jgi:hypothetical protein
MRATLDVFSGRPNPTWRLSLQQAHELGDRLGRTALPAAAGPIQPPRLGFRGFVVDEDEPGELVPSVAPVRQRFRVAGPDPEPLLAGSGTLLPPDTFAFDRRAFARRVAEAPTAELDAAEWLLETVPDHVDGHLAGVVSEQIAAVRGAAPDGEPETESTATAEVADYALVASVTPDRCQPFLAPKNLGFWNQPAIQPFNNCYNYASNFVSGTRAQPGRRSGHMYTAFGCDEVLAAAERDGLQTECHGSVRVVALGIWPGFDFHWWRLHPGGFWAHKIGWWPAQDTDNSFRVIGNGLTPANCDRGPYTQFCAYYFAPLSMQVA